MTHNGVNSTQRNRPLVFFAGWVWGIDNFAKAARLKSPFSKKMLGILIKYVNPVIIIVLALQLFGVIK